MTESVPSAEQAFPEDEIQKSYERPKKYVKDIPEKIKKEVDIPAGVFPCSSSLVDVLL